MRAYFLLAAPVFFLLSVTSVRAAGPVWTVRDIDQFQDNFASDGTLTGFVRADMANDILPASSPGILPGDSSVVVVADPVFGLATDGVLGGKAVYCYLNVNPQGQASKIGAGLSGGSRWPFAGTQVIGGHTWTKLRLDQSDLGGGPIPDNYCIDLNDNLFTPGDTIFFFYAAKSNDGPGTTNYFSLEFGTTTDITIAAALPMEFTCLPAGGFNRGGDVLLVDAGEDGVQAYWDSAFLILGLHTKIDRYDVRGPSASGNNTPASRVTNIAGQLNAGYRTLLWECGSLHATLGDGTGAPRKTDDYGLLNNFLLNLTLLGGAYLSGDDIAETLATATGASAATFRDTFMQFTLTSSDHVAAGLGLSPHVTHWPGRLYSDDFLLFGGSPVPNDFDVLHAAGVSRVEMSYGAAQSANAAVVSQSTFVGGASATVIMSGFSFADVRDDDLNGISDRAKFLRDMFPIMGQSLPQVTGSGPAVSDNLAQNHPNPFNPQTTIAFSIAARGHVALSIYDVNGSLVRTLADDTRPVGAYELIWNGRDQRGHDVASGVYFYRLVAPGFTQTRKMVLIK